MALLAEAGYPVNGLSSVTGYYRINQRFDDTTVTWDGFSSQPPRTLHVVSYDTMTACVKHGFTVSTDDWPLVWVYANKPADRQ